MMAIVNLDARGLKCPMPVLKVVSMAPKIPDGDILEVAGDCPTFEQDIRRWCERESKTMLAVNTDGDGLVIKIQF